MSWLALVLSLLAFGSFAFSTDDHHYRFAGGRLAPAVKRRWRAGAWLALVLAYAAAVKAQGWAFGSVLWFGVIILAAGTTFLLLNLGDRRARSAVGRRIR